MAQLARANSPKTQMPEIAAWIEQLRAKLGAELVDNAMRNGMKNGGFWAIENGLVVGTPPLDAIKRAQAELDRVEASQSASTDGGAARATGQSPI